MTCVPDSSSQITVSSSPKPSSSSDDIRTRCCGRVPEIGSSGSDDGVTSLTAQTRSRQRTTWPSSGITTSTVISAVPVRAAVTVARGWEWRPLPEIPYPTGTRPGVGNCCRDRCDDLGALTAEPQRRHGLSHQLLLGTKQGVRFNPTHRNDKLRVAVSRYTPGSFYDRTAAPSGRAGRASSSPGIHNWHNLARLSLIAGYAIDRNHCRLVGRDSPLDLAVTVVEPVLAPDSMKRPAQAFEVLLAEPVAVASCRGRVIGGAVALDGEHHLAAVARVLRCVVDPVAGAPVLSDQRNAGSA